MKARKIGKIWKDNWDSKKPWNLQLKNGIWSTETKKQAIEAKQVFKNCSPSY